MIIKVYLDSKSVLADTLHLTFECKKGFYKSLSASNGVHNPFSTLELNDDEVSIKTDFFVEGINSEKDLEELLVMFKSIPTTDRDGEKLLASNWLCFDSGTPFSEVELFILNLKK